MKLLARTPRDTEDIARAFAACLAAGDVVFLEGDLGAGKSVFVRGAARALGVKDAMPSPTFTLMQGYEGDVKVYHLDLYRLESPDEFFEAGLDECLSGDGVAFIEWPDNALTDADATARVVLRVAENGEREIEIHDEARFAGALCPWRQA